MLFPYLSAFLLVILAQVKELQIAFYCQSVELFHNLISWWFSKFSFPFELFWLGSFQPSYDDCSCFLFFWYFFLIQDWSIMGSIKFGESSSHRAATGLPCSVWNCSSLESWLRFSTTIPICCQAWKDSFRECLEEGPTRLPGSSSRQVSPAIITSHSILLPWLTAEDRKAFSLCQSIFFVDFGTFVAFHLLYVGVCQHIQEIVSFFSWHAPSSTAKISLCLFSALWFFDQLHFRGFFLEEIGRS